MPAFGTRSRSRLETCHPDLKRLFYAVVREFDCSVLCGYRDRDKQDRYFEEGKSKLKFPDSKHNKMPSMAIDIAPYPIDWDDINRFYYFAGYVKGKAEELGIKVRWGGDWDSDTEVKDQTFNDLPHFELVL